MPQSHRKPQGAWRMSANTLYDIRYLKHRYGNGPVTVDIDSLVIKEGNVYGLVGPNGSGKSTLLKILAFLEQCDEGSLLFDGKESTGREVELRMDVTYLLQNSYLLKRSVYENIAYGLKLRGKTDGMKGRIHDSLRRVGLEPDKFAERPWFRLSGGEVQRVALATRLALHPRVLLLDEPTANVDEPSAQLVKEATVSAWKEWGTTVIVATHDLVWLYEVSTDIINLYRGHVVGHGTENLIQGFWEAEGLYAVRTLSDGQKIYGLRNGHNENATGLINPSNIALSRTKQQHTKLMNALKGTVTQMALERSTGCVLVTVDIGGTILKSRVSLSFIETESICPAATVWLIFSSEDVRWV